MPAIIKIRIFKIILGFVVLPILLIGGYYVVIWILSSGISHWISIPLILILAFSVIYIFIFCFVKYFLGRLAEWENEVKIRKSIWIRE